MSRAYKIGDFSSGMSRLREKGGASDKSLYTIINGKVTQTGDIESRYGTDEELIPAGTKGLVGFDGKLVVFATTPVAITNPKIRVEVIKHPENPALELRWIHKAFGQLGSLYVVAEFMDGAVFHFWLRQQPSWKANNPHLFGDVIQPSIQNGYLYVAERLGAADPVWQPNVSSSVGTVVEPSEQTGFRFTVTDTIGLAPTTGRTEPEWQNVDQALTIEDIGVTQSSSAQITKAPDDASIKLPPDVLTRYGGGLNKGYEGKAK